MASVSIKDTKPNVLPGRASPSEKPPLATKRHSTFYFDNTLVVIQIEDTLFNVHKYQLLKSETFSNMFQLPKEPSNTPEEGSSAEHPIAMKGIAASDFEALLRVLYATTSIIFPSHFTTNQPAPESTLIIPAFRLANMWNFKDLCAYLMPLAEEVLSDVDKIVFAREFQLDQWIVPAHVKLCQREKPLNSEEASKVGLESLLFISRTREVRLKSPDMAENSIKGKAESWIKRGCNFSF